MNAKTVDDVCSRLVYAFHWRNIGRTYLRDVDVAHVFELVKSPNFGARSPCRSGDISQCRTTMLRRDTHGGFARWSVVDCLAHDSGPPLRSCRNTSSAPR